MEEYPREVQGQPLLLVALVGATALHPRLIEALQDAAIAACGARRTKYLSSSYDMRILPAKRGAKDGPNYKVEGILKRRWLEKVCNTIPAVLVLCIDWSDDLSQPEKEESQALHYLQHARRQAKERDLRLLVLVVLHPSTVDQEAACAALVRQGTSVVAMGKEDLAAKAPRLERLIYQNAMAFYSDEEKRVKKVWVPKTPNAAAQAAMQVRTNFKVAFLNEFRKDARAALTAYIKAYEQLLKDADVADAVERMDLCNYITVRMYQRYFASHDVGAAVHHCRIHTASLRRCCVDDEELVWRKWHWLSLTNHQIFGDLLDNVVQKVPSLIDQSDMWQFSGFHFQSAALYSRRLREWALRCLEPGHLLPPWNQGGELQASPYLGQAGHLERPSEVDSPHLEVRLRLAHGQAKKYQDHADRSLKLLIRTQASAKERGFASWVTVSQLRLAEAYLCDQEAGHREAARNLFERVRRGPSTWPSLQRFALERSIFCGCSALRLPVPSACSLSRALPAETGPDSGAEGLDMEKVRECLVRDIFEYLKTSNQDQSELLELAATAASALAPGAVEVALEPGCLSWEFETFQVSFDVPFPLELGKHCVAVSSAGEVPVARHGEASPLVVQGRLQHGSVTSVKLPWAAPAVLFTGACGGDTFRDWRAQLPGFASAPKTSTPRAKAAGDMRAEVSFPVDPGKAMVAEAFVCFAVVRAPATPRQGAELFLSCSLNMLEDLDETPPSNQLDSSLAPSVSLIRDWDLQPVSDLVGEKVAVQEAKLRPVPGILVFEEQAEGTQVCKWPLVVQCGRSCRVALRLSLEMNGTSISVSAPLINFQHALKLHLVEERVAAALENQRPAPFALKCAASIQATAVEAVYQKDSSEISAACLGTPGPMLCGSSYAFLLPPAPERALTRPRLRVRFQRRNALEAFFPFSEAERDRQPPSPLPCAVTEWSLPWPGGPSLPTTMQVELDVCSTGTVGAPLAAAVRLKHAAISDHDEIKIRIMPGEGEVSDRYLLSGPVCYQAAVPVGKDPNEAIPGFALIPLKAGWLSLPRVQVNWGTQEACSSTSSVFISPAGAALWRA
ncbi:unnamed protein product [Effrenium voratum]|uniref:Trafficking protein particle complex subunit 11 n=1 Tax=Effrenium voratum TaxID=2562239 RepID=A0AA36HVZ4_9DINO|nr:unnamed protein product [Effrenium voratum]